MAVISESISSASQHIEGILLLLGVLYLTSNYLTPGVCSVPGPFLAKLSNLWRFIDVANGHAEATLYKLHQKYGDYVRVGPQVVSIRDLDALKVIYGINKGYRKVRCPCYIVPHALSHIHLEDTLLPCTAAISQGEAHSHTLHHDG
jgi:hypothetical protein